MGWWKTVKQGAMGKWKNSLLASTASNTVQFSYRTLEHLFELVGVAPRVVRSVVTHPPTRTVAGHILLVAGQNLLLSNLVFSLNYYAQRQGEEYLDANDGNTWFSTAIQASLLFLAAGATIYKYRNNLEFKVRTIVLTLEAHSASNETIAIQPNVCKDENITLLNSLRNSIQDHSVFVFTELAIDLVAYIPGIGNYISQGFSIYHKGRYITTMLLPICYDHQAHYLNEYPEFALAQGLSHAILSALCALVIQQFCSIPAIYYELALQELLLPVQVIITAHNRLPEPVKNSTRQLHDPLAVYAKIVNLFIDTFLIGAKKTFPSSIRKLLNSRETAFIPWQKISSVAERIWMHPLAAKIKPLVLPSLLQGEKQFLKDPFISHHWTELKQLLLKFVKHTKKRSKLVQQLPFPAETLKFTYGVPKELTIMVLKILNNTGILDNLQRKIENMHTGPLPEVQPTKSTVLNGQQTKTNIEVSSHPEAKVVSQINFPPKIETVTPQNSSTASLRFFSPRGSNNELPSTAIGRLSYL